MPRPTDLKIRQLIESRITGDPRLRYHTDAVVWYLSQSLKHLSLLRHSSEGGGR